MEITDCFSISITPNYAYVSSKKAYYMLHYEIL